jgi:hypothetical protein
MGIIERWSHHFESVVLEKMMSTVIALELKNHEMKIGGIGVYGL